MKFLRDILFFPTAYVAFVASACCAEWAVSVTGPFQQSSEVAGVAFDGTSNCFFSGRFRGPASFGSTNLTSVSQFDSFLAKATLNGVIAWVQQVSGNGPGLAAKAVTADVHGNSYLCGNFQGTLSIGASNITSDGANIFLAKFNPSGSLLFLRRIGAPGYALPLGIVVSISDEIFLTGGFGQSVTFGTNAYSTSANGEFFLAKLDALGSVIWSRRSIHPVNASGIGRSVAPSPDGGAFVGGDFSQTAIFGTNSLISAGREDAFIAKYSATGNLEWIRQGGGSDVDLTTAVAVSAQGNGCYASGSFIGSVNLFGSNLVSRASTDAFTAALNTDGSLAWIRQVSASQSCGLSSDSDGNAYVLLRFLNNVGFENLNGWGAVLKYQQTGRQMWPRSLGVNPSSSLALVGIAAVTNDSVLIGTMGGGEFGFTNAQGGVVFARIAAPLPELRIAKEAEEVVVTWPGWADDFSLQGQLPPLHSNTWAIFTNWSGGSETTLTYRTNAIESAVLFRLRK